MPVEPTEGLATTAGEVVVVPSSHGETGRHFACRGEEQQMCKGAYEKQVNIGRRIERLGSEQQPRLWHPSRAETAGIVDAVF